MVAPTARSVAAAVLVRVDRDSAFASSVLDTELGRARQLDARDRALATELVYGSLRVRPWLDAQIERHAVRGTNRIDPFTRIELALAVYQLFFLTRIPAFAAVNEAVDAIRRTRGSGVSRFANAVLRKLAMEAVEQSGENIAGLAEKAIWESTPEWLRAALARALGEDSAKAFLRPGNTVPPIGIRVERAEEREAWLARLRLAVPAATFELGEVSPHAIRVHGAADVRGLAGFAEGAWSLQEEGSQLVALAVGARPGEHVLDACAGRGNKSAVLAGAVGQNGAIDVADVHPDKLERLALELGRLGLSPRATFAVDWAVGAGECEGLYERALVDAPCSGVGTARRRPELVPRRVPEDLAKLASLQQKILLGVSERVVPGGRLVYAVCSVLREEAEDVVGAVLAAAPSLELAPFEGLPARELAKEEPMLRLLPHVHATDGYFLASFRKKE
jgi:16S rRNA (cytosine967-C5)-methyltransferase